MAEKKVSTRKTTKAVVKKEMLDAYSEVLPDVEEDATLELKPERKAEQRAAAKAVAVADSISAEGIVGQIGALRSDVARLLNQLAERLEQEVSRYQSVLKAIEEKENDLKETYEIERAAGALAALIEAQNRRREEFEADLKERKEQAVAQIEAGRAEWEREKEHYEAVQKERQEAENRQRLREKEEYQYRYNREKQQLKDSLEDERAKIEREITVKREEMERDLAEREKNVVASEQELASLRDQVQVFPSQIQETVNRAVAEATSRLEETAKSREAIMQREFAGERNVLTTRIQSLELTIKEQAEQLARLSSQAEKAYQQVQEIALKAIEGSSGSKALSDLQQLLADQGRRPVEKG